jgi:hypothetical protein
MVLMVLLMARLVCDSLSFRIVVYMSKALTLLMILMVLMELLMARLVRDSLRC